MNTILASTVSDIPPGDALDLGCGPDGDFPKARILREIGEQAHT